MIIRKTITDNRRTKRWRLFVITKIAVLTTCLQATIYAHQSPNSLIFLDISPKSVAMEIQLPLSELELAFGNNISKNPETLIDQFGPQLKEYLSAHIKAYYKKDYPWQVKIESLNIDKGKYIETGIPYFEVVAHIQLIPQASENTRKFTLDYDAILHQVINHVALVSIRNDWERGQIETTAEATAISWNTRDNVIYPLKVNLDSGSWWLGFKSMIKLGMEHIKEGTDHLLFLLVLLLPAPLVVNRKRWGHFGGVRYSIVKLLKVITAFTIGHSLTLLVGALGWFHLPAQPVEILIAVSILVSAVHAIRPVFAEKEMYVAAGFGLIHGLAFATVLSNLNIDTNTMVTSVLGFNLGIEIMQIFVIALIIPWFVIMSKTQYFIYVKNGFAILAGFISIGWIVQRITENNNFITIAAEKLFVYIPWLILGLSILSVTLFSYTKFNKPKTVR